MPPALGQRLGAVPHHLPIGQQPGHHRMSLEALERVVRIEERVAVVEAGDESDRHPALRQRVDEPPTELLESQRVAQRVQYGPAANRSGGTSHSSLMPMA